MKTRITFLALAMTFTAWAEVEPQAHYNLKGNGGIRDMACPPALKDQAGKSPELIRQGSPKVMSNGPESRREEFDSSIKFEEPDQCYSVAKNLVQGDNFVVEVWAYAAKADDGGWHTIVANGTGATGFLIAQNGDQWAVLVGCVGGTNLGKIVPETWTHLAVVKSRGAVTGWVNGKNVCKLPDLGGGAENFSIGATGPGKEPFRGWVAEVRYSTFKPGKFDQGTDFLMDLKQHKIVQAAELAARTKLVESLLNAPGVTKVEKFDEKPVTADWLIQPPTTPAFVQILPGEKNQRAQIMLGNGLVSRTFQVADGNIGCISFKRSDKDIEFVRAIKPEVRLRVNGGGWLEVGGLAGAPDKGFITPDWEEHWESKPGAFLLTAMAVGPCIKPYEWQPKHGAPALPWPANGRRVTFRFVPPADAVAPLRDLIVDVSYEIYNGLPIIMKTFTVRNKTDKEIVVTQFEGEHLAVQPSNSRMMHVESDYSCGAVNWTEKSSGLGIHADGGRAGFKDYYMGGGTTRFIRDPDWGSMATLNPAEDLHLGDPENALLLSRPTVGPNWTVKAGGNFDAFRTFEILNDSPVLTERAFLAQRRFYKILAPQVNEFVLQFDIPSRDMNALKHVMDQAAEIGFHSVDIRYPTGISHTDVSDGNIRFVKELSDYAKKKGLLFGGYELMMASRGWGSPADNFNCIDPATGKPGSMFGQSACGASAWADMYFNNMFKLQADSGFTIFGPDGPYHGDCCAAKNHPHHKGIEDSQWAQWKWMCDVIHECQKRGQHVVIPDYYFLQGASCTGMGFREATAGLPIALQMMLYRQYMFDGTFHKTAGMGYVSCHTSVLPGGMEKNLAQYEFNFFTMLSYGAKLIVDGSQFYDGPNSRAMLLKWMNWYRQHREIIHGDIIHLRRPDGRGLDYILHVNPAGKEKGMLLVFNPLSKEVRQTLDIPLYYTGLTDTAKIREQDGEPKTFRPDREYSVKIPLTIPANGYTWLVIE